MDEGETRKKGEGSAVSRQVRPRVVRTGEAGERLKTEGSSASWPGRATIQSLSLSPSCLGLEALREGTERTTGDSQGKSVSNVTCGPADASCLLLPCL